jgi:hypothetical protein
MSININLEKAKNIWVDQIRIKRQPYLEQLDIEYIKALENNDITEQTNIINKKKALRDCTEDQRILDANSVDSLKLIDPVSEIMS